MALSRSEKRYNELAAKWLSGDITPEERDEFSEWYNEGQDKPVFIPRKFGRSERKYKQHLFSKIKADIGYQNRTRIIRLLWPAAAAAILIIGITVAFHFDGSKDLLVKKDQYAIQKSSVIKPGSNNAILTLANGSKINLTKITTGEIAKQSSSAVIKTANGQLNYSNEHSVHKNIEDAEIVFNKVETPIGGQYEISLSDGTKVWLNAASSLKFPAQFATNERRVELTGEAYFEVTKNKDKPFKVITDKQEIEVLGTHFNVNAYQDEMTIKTTLLEGSVKIDQTQNGHSNHGPVFLKPGQESVLDLNRIQVNIVDTDSAIAWKNGYFNFNEDIKSIMKKLARWYDIEVVYNINKDQQLKYGGKISRSKSIYSVLKIMEATGHVHFKIEGRRVTVMN